MLGNGKNLAEGRVNAIVLPLPEYTPFVLLLLKSMGSDCHWTVIPYKALL